MEVLVLIAGLALVCLGVSVYYIQQCINHSKNKYSMVVHQ